VRSKKAIEYIEARKKKRKRRERKRTKKEEKNNRKFYFVPNTIDIIVHVCILRLSLLRYLPTFQGTTFHYPLFTFHFLNWLELLFCIVFCTKTNKIKSLGLIQSLLTSSTSTTCLLFNRQQNYKVALFANGFYI